MILKQVHTPKTLQYIELFFKLYEMSQSCKKLNFEKIV